MRSILFALALAISVSLTALLITSSLAVQDSASVGRPIANNPELKLIYQEDQAERAKGQKPGLDAAERDREQLKRVAELLDAGAARTADDFFHEPRRDGGGLFARARIGGARGVEREHAGAFPERRVP
jgi:hypothetical protein